MHFLLLSYYINKFYIAPQPLYHVYAALELPLYINIQMACFEIQLYMNKQS